MSATPANSQAALEASKNGKPFHICISTTPGDLNTPQGVYAKSFFDNAAVFTEQMYDWDMDKVANYIDRNSGNGFVYIEFSYKQLGRTEEWFKKQAKALNGDLFKIKREILLQWNKSSDLSPFSEAEIIRLHDHVKEPVTTLMVNGIYPLKIYNGEFDWRGNLLIGVDVASGMSRDATAVTIWDPSIGEIVATFHSNIIDGFELQEFLIELVGTFFSNSVLIIERNNSGIQLMDFLLRTKISRNIFYEKREIKAEKKVDDIKRQKFNTRMTKIYGVSTDTKTRPLMMDILRDIVREEYNTLNSKELVEEIAGLERTKNDKIEHGENGHDDMVMSYLVLRYVWAYGKNLGNWFISKSSIEAGESNHGDKQFSRKMSIINEFNKSDSFKNNRNSMSSQIIQEWNNKKQYREYEDELDQMTSRRTSSIRGIMDLNKK